MLTLGQMRDFVLALLPPQFPKETVSTPLLNEIIYQQMLVVQLEHINTILPHYVAQDGGTLEETVLKTTPNLSIMSANLPSDILRIEENIKTLLVSYEISNPAGYMPQPAKILSFDQFIKESADSYTTDYNNPIAATDNMKLYVSPPALSNSTALYQLWYYRIPVKPTSDATALDIPDAYLGELGMKVINYILSLFTMSNQQPPAVEQAVIYRYQTETARSMGDAIERP